MSEPSFKHRVVSALGWSTATQLGAQGTRVGITLLLTRLLTPDQFGQVAVIITIVEIVAIIADFGLAQALIRLKEIERRHMDSAFALNAALGATLFGAFWFAAPWISRFYEAPILTSLARAMALQFVFSGLSAVPMALLQRELDYKRLLRIEVVSLAPAGVVAVTLAALGYGVWSLVALGLLTGLLRWLQLTTRYRPGLALDREATRDLLGYGSNILGAQLLNTVAERVPGLIIGKVVGLGVLGNYNRAYELMRMPLRQFGAVAGRVLFPALSMIQDERERSQRIMLLAHRLMGFVGFPAWAGFAVVADDATWVVIGAQWGDATILFRLFAIMCIPGVIGVSTGWVLQAQNRPDLVLKWNIYSVAVRIFAVVVGIQWGAIGVAAMFTVATWIFYWIPGWSLSMGLLGVSLSRTLRNVAPGAAITAIMCAVVAAVVPTLDGIPYRWLQLLIEVSVGVVVYVGLAAGLRIEAWQDLLRLGRQAIARRRGGDQRA